MMNAIAKFIPRKDAVAALEAQLASLSAKGAAMLEELEKRQAALADIEDDDEVLAASGRVTVARNKLRKIEAEIAEVRQKLAHARDVARVRLHADLRAAYAKVLGEFLTAAEALLPKAYKVLEAREEFFLAGFQAEHRYAPKLPRTGTALAFDDEILERVRGELEVFSAPGSYFPEDTYPRDPAIAAAARAANERVTAAAVAAAAALPPKEEPKPAPPTQAPIRVSLNAVGTPVPPRRDPLREVLGEGERVVTVLRDGIELPGKGQLLAGDEVALPVAAIVPFLRNGAVDLKDPADLAALGNALLAEPGLEGTAA